MNGASTRSGGNAAGGRHRLAPAGGTMPRSWYPCTMGSHHSPSRVRKCPSGALESEASTAGLGAEALESEALESEVLESEERGSEERGSAGSTSEGLESESGQGLVGSAGLGWESAACWTSHARLRP